MSERMFTEAEVEAQVAPLREQVALLRTLRAQAEGMADRNAEDAALWRAHYNRTYGAKTGTWVNADGTQSPIEPATTASAEVSTDWAAVALRTLHGAGEWKLRADAAESALRQVRDGLERLADEWESEADPLPWAAEQIRARAGVAN